MNSLTKFTQISFLIPAGSDVQKTVSFYEKLGFQVTHKEKDPPRMAVLERDCAVFYLCHENYQQLGQPINIRILVNNIDLFYQDRSFALTEF